LLEIYFKPLSNVYLTAGHSLRGHLEVAIKEAVEHRAALVALAEGLRSVSGSDVEEWDTILEAYHKDPEGMSKSNLYQIPGTGNNSSVSSRLSWLITYPELSFAKVRLRYAREETLAAERAGNAGPEVGASVFLAAGLELEEYQYVLYASL
jgi:hypothetical protein